jgi:phosphoglycerate dehydrogenase-like enzyme
MGKKVIYFGEPTGSRTIRANELAPADLDVGYVDPTAPADQRREELKDAEALITNGLLWTTDQIAAMPNLKLLQLMSAGFNTLDVASIREMGVEVCNNSPAISNSVAEHAISLMMLTYKRLEQGIAGVKDGAWQDHAKGGEFGKLYELSGRTVGIIGLGNIGSKVAKRLTGFETTTLYYDVREFDPEYERSLNVTRVSFDELLERSDIVTVHVPLNSRTTKMFSTREFAAMKNDAVFINTCRGPVQDEAALIAALQNGEFAAAGLDVFEEEPTPLDNPLLHMDNVVVTPHLAGSTQERVDRALVFSFENARRVLNGEKPQNAVDIQD